jgi:hypothetical protein
MLNNKDIEHSFEKAIEPDYFGLEALSSTEDNVTIDVFETGSDEEPSEPSMTDAVENVTDSDESNNEESVTFDSLVNASKPIVEDKNPSAIGNRPAQKGGNNNKNKNKNKNKNNKGGNRKKR